MMGISVKFVVMVLLVLLAACSDVPGERQLQQLLQQEYDSRYKGLVEIENIRKINGWHEEKQLYTAEMSYQITFKKSFKEYMDAQTALPGNPLEKMAKGMSVGMLKLQFGNFKADDSYQVQEQIIQLRKTEQGWAIID